MLRVRLIEEVIIKLQKKKNPAATKEFCDWLRNEMNTIYEEAYQKGRNMARGHLKK